MIDLHARGPWVIEEINNYQGCPDLTGAMIHNHQVAIAEVCGAVKLRGDVQHPENSVNARLIAAAPDLLQLAKDFEVWEALVIQDGDWAGEVVTLTPELHEGWLRLAAQRNAAVAKATGAA